ncbi:MAG: DUF1622 domain-containing protein [Dysgonamonadaceae bacterium]|jgi:uncharacterized membrane protein|nr:DUF1622 domain-containing protein [Dysgonamonadaceae bacterium]
MIYFRGFILRLEFLGGVRMELELTNIFLEIFMRFFEIVSALLVIYGGLIATIKILLVEAFKRPYKYEDIRKEFTNKILFGLELLIVGDILGTIRNPTVNDLMLVGTIVVIRTVLGYFLSKEAKEYHFD